MGSTVPAGVATPGTTAPDSAAMGAPTKQAPATGAAITEETVMAAETQPARGRPGWLLPAFAGLATAGRVYAVQRGGSGECPSAGPRTVDQAGGSAGGPAGLWRRISRHSNVIHPSDSPGTADGSDLPAPGWRAQETQNTATKIQCCRLILGETLVSWKPRKPQPGPIYT